MPSVWCDKASSQIVCAREEGNDGAVKHMGGLAEYGVTELHRKSYVPVKRAMMVP